MNWVRGFTTSALAGPAAAAGAYFAGGKEPVGLITVAVAVFIFAGIGIAYTLRNVSVTAPGKSIDDAVKAAAADWRLKNLKLTQDGGAAKLSRGKGMLSDEISLSSGAGGVTLTGPAQIVNILKKKLA